MKILVAGGAGYVGSVLIPKLLPRGYKIKDRNGLTLQKWQADSRSDHFTVVTCR